MKTALGTHEYENSIKIAGMEIRNAWTYKLEKQEMTKEAQNIIRNAGTHEQYWKCRNMTQEYRNNFPLASFNFYYASSSI